MHLFNASLAAKKTLPHYDVSDAYKYLLSPFLSDLSPFLTIYKWGLSGVGEGGDLQGNSDHLAHLVSASMSSLSPT